MITLWNITEIVSEPLGKDEAASAYIEIGLALGQIDVKGGIKHMKWSILAVTIVTPPLSEALDVLKCTVTALSSNFTFLHHIPSL